MFDAWNISEEKSGEDKECNPRYSADDVVQHECLRTHCSCSRHEWCDGADDRDEAREHNSFCTVFFIECVRFYEVRFLENVRTFGEYFFSQPFAQCVIHDVAGHRCNGKNQEEKCNIKTPKRGECSCSEEQRITGEKRRDDQPCFTEDYQKQKQIRECSVLSDDELQVSVEVEEEVEHMRDGIRIRARKNSQFYILHSQFGYPPNVYAYAATPFPWSLRTTSCVP